MISIDSFRELALSFPSVTEEPHFEKTSFRVKKKIFATLDTSKQTAVIKLTEIQQSVFCAFDITIIYPVKGAWGKQGWTVMELQKVNIETLMDALSTSYKNVAK